MIQVTASAVKEVTRMLAEQAKGPTPSDRSRGFDASSSQEAKPEGTGLRLAVKGGGCSGLSYDMAFDAGRKGDHEFTFDGLKVYVDPKSYLYLDGITFDYSDGLKDKGFKFVNPNASKTCGCGESFSV